MTPDEAKEIVRRALAGMKPENLEWWMKEIAEQESFFRKLVQRWKWFQHGWKIASRWVLLVLIIIAVLMWIRACNELRSTPRTPIPSGLACASDGRDKMYHYIQASTWKGCRTSMDMAFQQAEDSCKALTSSCTGGSACAPKTCGPGVVVKDLEHNSGVLFMTCDTYVGFTCDCGCR